MAASVINTTKTDENLETYCLIWVDSSVNNSKENLNAQQQLRTSINHLLTFEDDQQCLQHIHSLPKDDRAVLIVSGRLGRILVPQIVQSRQIISVYVYGMDQKANQQWAQHFSKVKVVVVRLDELIQQIQTDQIQRQHHKMDETLSISIFNSSVEGEGQSSSELNGQFIHSQLLIDSLIRTKPSNDEREELIILCQQQYKDNHAELQIIKEFERDYTSNRSLWWYTRQSFVYRLLNKALRVQNIHILYSFRFLIRDLEEELERNKCSSPIRVYRAQQMSKEEIEMLNQSVGQFISMNSFLSTSINREGARMFLSPADPSLEIEPVFFEIDADPQLNNIKPFSNITSFSYFHDEEEVLFMIGSIFRLVQVKCDDDGVWNIRMMLCSENDNQLQSLFQHMKNELEDRGSDLLQFGHVVRRMGKLDDAEKYYHRYLNQLSDDHPHIANCCHVLGSVTYTKGDYDSSLKWHHKSLEIKMRTLEPDHPNIATSHNSIAIVHQRKGDYAHALESLEKALTIRKKVYGEDHPLLAMCLNNMGIIYGKKKKYSKALEYYQKALIIWQKHLPADHSDLGASHNNIGSIHQCLGNYDQSLEHYNLSLKIFTKSLPTQHHTIAMTLENIGLVYENKGDLQEALSYFNKAAKIYLHSLPSTHSDVIQIEQRIQRVLSEIK